MKKFKIIFNIFKTTGLIKFIAFYLFCFLVIAATLHYTDPAIKTFEDGLWYCFVSSATIGFGDIIVTTTLGKLLTVFLSLYSLLLIGFIPGIIVTYFGEFNKVKSNESVMSFLDKLEHLDELSKEELCSISEKVKEKRYKL